MSRNRRYELTGGAAVATCLVVIVLGILWIAFLSWVFQTVWNIVVPSVFGGPFLDYPQSVALMLLFSIIGGFFKSTFTAKA